MDALLLVEFIDTYLMLSPSPATPPPEAASARSSLRSRLEEIGSPFAWGQGLPSGSSGESPAAEAETELAVSEPLLSLSRSMGALTLAGSSLLAGGAVRAELSLSKSEVASASASSRLSPSLASTLRLVAGSITKVVGGVAGTARSTTISAIWFRTARSATSSTCHAPRSMWEKHPGSPSHAAFRFVLFTR